MPVSTSRAACVLAALFLAAPAGTAAQTTGGSGMDEAAGAEDGGVETIGAAPLRRTVGALAADSMRGRDTPSPELARTARYLAERFEAAGARPGLGRDGYLQWYPLTVTEPGASDRQRLRLEGPDGTVDLRPDREFVALPTGGTASAGGRLLPWRIGAAPDSGIALVRISPDSLGRTLDELRGALEEQGLAGAVVAVDGSRDWFERIRGYLSARQVSLGRPSGLDKPAVLVRTADLPEKLVRAMEEGETAGRWSAELRTAASVDSARAPNVVGWIEGSDPTLSSEYVVVSAHMDGLGVGEAVEGDSIYNGADDNASGTAALVALAEAFATARAPRRSVVLLAVSGEEKGLLGSSWYVEHPVFSVERTVAAVNIDMIGRNWRDTAVAIGQDLSSLGETVQRVAAEHPELGLTVVEDRWPEENFFFRSDHYNFARNGVPALFFFSGTHEDYHRPSDEADEIDYGKTARIVRLVYRLVNEVADAPQPPRWDPEARERVVEAEEGS